MFNPRNNASIEEERPHQFQPDWLFVLCGKFAGGLDDDLFGYLDGMVDRAPGSVEATATALLGSIPSAEQLAAGHPVSSATKPI
jgi:hypothetical protein